MGESPHFQHDCAACTFLGSYEGSDLYHCPQHGFPTLIVRRSDVPQDYTSFLAEIVRRDSRQFSSYLPGLVEALRRATSRNLALGGGAVV